MSTTGPPAAGKDSRAAEARARARAIGSVAEEAPKGWRAWLPPMERAERQELFVRVEAGATGGRDYHVMMALSAMLASLGLLQGSTAVVIGAMLVAPLMGPLLGAGLALVQGNLKLIRRSMAVAATGIATGLGIAVFLGGINPGYEPTMEVEARGKPDVFDLFVALTSGMIAAYAQCRTNLSNTIAGVAIAAALLPPLAVVGIAATMEEVEIAVYASVLLVTNVVAIVLGAALVFRVMGVQVQARETGARRWVRQAVAALLFLSILLVAPLMIQGMDKYRTGPTRPASYPVSVPVRRAVAQFLSQYPGIDVISMARLSVEPESGITVVLSTLEPVPTGFRRGLRNSVRQARGLPLIGDLLDKSQERVRIYIMMEAPYAPDAPENTPESELEASVEPAGDGGNSPDSGPD